MPVIVGFTLNGVAKTAVSAGVTTETRPGVAAAGAGVVICVSEGTGKGGATPLNRTAVAPVKLVPVIVTAAPTGAPGSGLGEMLMMRAWSRNDATLRSVPSAVVTRTFPLVAPAGTVARSDVADSRVTKLDAVP